MSNNKQIEKPLELPHQETIVGTNTIQTKPFDNQKTMSNNKQSNYNLMWAIAILREDYHHCWRLIAERMGCSEWKARYLYSRIKNNYKL